MNYRILTALFLIMIAPVSAAEEPAESGEDPYGSGEQEVHGTEALEMITQRMQDLSGSLSKMPQIPKLDETIMIPDGRDVKRREKTGATKKKEITE